MLSELLMTEELVYFARDVHDDHADDGRGLVAAAAGRAAPQLVRGELNDGTGRHDQGASQITLPSC